MFVTILVLLSLIGFTAIAMGSTGPLHRRALFACAITTVLALSPVAAVLR